MKDAKPSLSRASVVRLMACQALCMYNDELSDCKNLNEILESINEYYVKDYLGKENPTKNDYKSLYKTEFIRNMLSNVVDQIKEIDDILEKETRNFNNTIENLLDTTRECFRLAIYEFQNFPELASEIIINEYVDIVAEFTNDTNETRFANRVLENLAVKLRNKEEKNIEKVEDKGKKGRKIISLHKTE